MRRLAAIVVVGLLAAAGCGGGERPASPSRSVDMAKYGPRKAVAGVTPGPARIHVVAPAASVARQLDGGEIGVVGLDGVVAVRPSSLETSSDGTLQGLRWSHWGASGASATGRMRLLDCQPNCATGGVNTVDVTVELSRVKSCGGRRYFSSASITLAGRPRPASYVRAPC